MSKKTSGPPAGRYASALLAAGPEMIVLGVSKGKYTHAEKLVRKLDAMTIAGAMEGNEEDQKACIYFFGASLLAGLAPNTVGPEGIWQWLGEMAGIDKMLAEPEPVVDPGAEGVTEINDGGLLTNSDGVEAPAPEVAAESTSGA